MGIFRRIALRRAADGRIDREALSSSTAPLALALEPRYMFDAAGAATAAEAATDDAANQAAAMAVAPERREIAAVDTSIDDHEALVAAAEAAGMEVVLISGGEDGLAQLADALRGRENIDALHILSHGDVGTLQLGSSVLTAETLDDHAATLEVIGGTLSTDGDLLLYGCRVGEGEAGLGFIEDVALLTAADVAASDDVTGNAARGGDWSLESHVGAVESKTLFGNGVSGFTGLLAYTGTINFSNQDSIGANSNTASADASFTAGAYTLVVDGAVRGTYDGGQWGDPAYAVAYFGGTDGAETQVTLSFSGGETFDFNGILIKNVSGAAATFQIASNTGQTASTASLGDLNTETISVSWSDVSKIYITATAGKLWGSVDNMAVANVQPANAAPVFVNSGPYSVTETAGTGTTVGDVNAHDGESNGNDTNVTYSIVGGNSNKDGDGTSLFAIDANTGVITIADGDDLDYETATSHSLTIRANDGSQTTDASVTVNVGNVAPAVTTGQSFGVNHSDGNGTVVGTVAQDAGADDDSVTYSIQSGNTGGAFTINAQTGQITVNDSTALDDEGDNTFDLVIRASDGTTNSDQTVTITATDDVAPTATTAPAGTPAANASSVDYTVTFSESVSNVTADDFQLTTTGSASGTIASVSGSGTSWTVTVNTIAGDGTLRLDLKTGTDITDAAGNAAGAYSGGSTHTVDRVAPTVTAGNISLSGATGTGGAFKAGDTVTATWDNTAGGDNNTDTITGVTVDFSQFGGGAAVVATNVAGTWTATYVIGSGAIDATNRNVSVTATDDAGNATTVADTANATLDNQAPTVTDANIAVTSTGSGTGGAYKVGDTITLRWTDTGGDANADTISGVTVDFSAFGGGAAVAATNTAGVWEASTVLTAGAIDGTNLNAAITVTDNAGNTTTTADTSNLTVDTQAPTVSDGNISLSGATGSGGAFKAGDTITATWNNTGAGDNNADVASVTFDFSAFGGGAAVAATNSSGTWTATYTLAAGSLDATNLNVSATVTDDAGNVTTTADTTNATADTQAPGTPTGTLAVDENSANGSAVGTVSGGGADGVTYSLVDDAGGRFAITGGGAVTVANGSLLDRETNASHSITVRATDNAGNTSDAVLTVSIANVNEAPTLSNLNGDSVNFSIGGGAVVLDGGTAAGLDDVDSADFDGGAVTVSITANGQAGEDVLSVGAVGPITVAGATVSHSGTPIGTIAGGTGGADLVVSLNADATVARVQDLVRALSYQDTDAATVNTAARTVRVTVSDGDGATSAASDVTVSLVRAPIIDLDGDDSSGATNGGFALTFTEDGGAVAVADSDTTISDDGTFKSLTVTLTNRPDGASESLSSTYGTGAQTVNGEAVTIGAYDAGTGTLTITVDDASTDAATMQMLMESIRYENTAQAPDTTARSITFAATDDADNTGSAATATVTMQAQNDDPTMVGIPSDVTVTEDTASAVDLSAVTFADVDAGANPVTLALTASAGTLTATSGGGVTVAGAGTGSLTLTGTVAAIDAFLNSATAVTYTAATDANGDNAATLTLTANDGGNSGAGGGTNVTLGTVNLDVTAVNDDPTVSGLPASVSVTEDTTQAIDLSALTLADVDAGGGTLTVTLEAGAGTLYSASGGGVTVGGSGTGTLTLTGTLAALNGFIDTNGALSPIGGRPTPRRPIR